jgi:predicted DNA-binding protein
MRSQLRIADLQRGTRVPSRMMNVRIPTDVAEAIDQLSKKLGASKTDVVSALLNEGLNVARKKRGG